MTEWFKSDTFPSWYKRLLLLLSGFQTHLYLTFTSSKPDSERLSPTICCLWVSYRDELKRVSADLHPASGRHDEPPQLDCGMWSSPSRGPCFYVIRLRQQLHTEADVNTIHSTLWILFILTDEVLQLHLVEHWNDDIMCCPLHASSPFIETIVFFPHYSGTACWEKGKKKRCVTSSKSVCPARSQSEPQSALVKSSTNSSQRVVTLASDWNSTLETYQYNNCIP